MRTQSALLLAIGTGSAGLLAGFLFFRSHRIQDEQLLREERTALALEREQIAKSSKPELPDLERPESRVPALTEAPAPPDSPPAVPAREQEAPATIDPDDPRRLPEGTLSEAAQKREAVVAYLNKQTRPIILQRFEEGLTEHATDDDAWKGGDSEWERMTIYGLQHEPDRKGWDRTVLPRWQYPGLYELKDESLRLEKLVQEKQLEEYYARQAQLQAGSPK